MLDRRVPDRRRSTTPFGYPTPKSFVAGMAEQTRGNYAEIPSYPRSGTKELHAFESGLERLLGLREGQKLYAMNSGMSAVVGAIELTNPSRGDIVVHGVSRQEYGKTGVYFNEDLAARGVISEAVDAGNIREIDEKLQTLKGKPVKAVFFETVGNGPEMPVLDVERFLELESLREAKPEVIVIDNTLPQNTSIDVAALIAKYPDLPIIGVESMTKFYFNNEGLGGFAIVGDPTLAEKLYQKRTRFGWTPDPAVVEKFAGLADLDPKEFAEDIALTMRNTQALAQAAASLPDHGKHFVVGYPGINSNLSSNNTAISPVFFISPTEQSGLSGEELFSRLYRSRGFAGVDITESFGFGSMTISLNKGVIRVAGGLDDAEKVKKQCDKLIWALAVALSEQ